MSRKAELKKYNLEQYTREIAETVNRRIKFLEASRKALAKAKRTARKIKQWLDATLKVANELVQVQRKRGRVAARAAAKRRSKNIRFRIQEGRRRCRQKREGRR